MKDRQYNVYNRKRQTIIDNTLYRKLKLEQHEPHLNFISLRSQKKGSISMYVF